MSNQLFKPKCWKIVLGTSIEEYGVLLRLKQQLGERFYVRNIDNSLDGGFVVAFTEDDIVLLDRDLKRRMVRMSDEGVNRFCAPFLYRFLPPQFLEDFRQGKLRLSTIARCRRLESEKRGDAHEGVVQFYCNGKKIASASATSNGYMLCTSLTPFALGSVPNGRCVIIQDVPGFVKAVTSAIREKQVEVAAIVQGPCIYTDHRVSLPEEPKHTQENLRVLLDDFGDRIYFLKDAQPSFVVEHEYRIIWLTDEEIEDETLDVQIDNPEQYVRVMQIPSYADMFKHCSVVAGNHPRVSMS